MAKSVKAIGEKKWRALSGVQKHTAIARFAEDCIRRDHDFDRFMDFYRKVRDWGPIDRYDPPHWLTPAEKLENFFVFHQKLSKKPPGYFRVEPLPGRIFWKPVLPVTVVLDQVITPFNVGSVLRLIDNFGFSELVYHNPHLDIQHRNLRRSARGTENWIPIRHEGDLPVFIKSRGIPFIALENTGKVLPLREWQPPSGPFGLVIGNEMFGISAAVRSACAAVVGLPVFGYKNALNLSHALAVAGYHIHRCHPDSPSS